MQETAAIQSRVSSFLVNTGLHPQLAETYLGWATNLITIAVPVTKSKGIADIFTNRTVAVPASASGVVEATSEITTNEK